MADDAEALALAAAAGMKLMDRIGEMEGVTDEMRAALDEAKREQRRTADALADARLGEAKLRRRLDEAMAQLEEAGEERDKTEDELIKAK